MKTLILVLFPFLLCAPAFSQTPAPNAAAFRKQSETLASIDKKFGAYAARLLRIKQELVDIRFRATTENIDNAARVFAKGGMDVAEKLTAPTGLGDAYGLLIDIFNNLTTEQAVWDATVHVRKVPLETWKHEVAALKTENRRLTQRCHELIVIIKSPLPRFDDDLPSFPSTEAFWRKPDKKEDDEIELITRKLTVIRGLSGALIDEIDAEVKGVAEKRKKVQAEQQAVAARLAGIKEAPPPKDKQADATPTPGRTIPGYERDEPDARGGDRFEERTTDRPPPRAELKERARIKAEAEKEKKRLAEERRRREENARIIIDPSSPSTLVAGEYGYYLASIDPPLEQAGIEWYIDDKRVRSATNDTASLLPAVFPQAGRHTIRAVLKIRGKESDQHIVNVNVMKPRKAAKYPPEMEGKKTLALDLGWCRYDALYQGGNIYLTGYYYTPQKQKVAYTSLPVENFTPQAAAAGFCLTKTSGYHIYQTESDDGETVYVITRMQGTEITVLHQLTVRRFQMEIAKDYSTITVKYQTEADLKSGKWQTITLR